MKTRTLLAIGLVLASGVGSAQTVAPDVRLAISCEAIVAASPADVWKAFTTKDGLESWMVGYASFDLRIGGLMRTKYEKKGELGDEGTIVNEVLAYEPERMLSIRVQKAPAGFPFPNAIKSMWTVIYFDPAPEGKTRVRCIGLGFTPDRESQTMRGHFEKGNQWTLDKLAAHFKK